MKNRLPCSGIGGQAVLEGIMMRNKDKYAVAVRAADKEIDCIIQCPPMRGVTLGVWNTERKEGRRKIKQAMNGQDGNAASTYCFWVGRGEGSRGRQRAQGHFGSYLTLLTATSSAWDVAGA